MSRFWIPRLAKRELLANRRFSAFFCLNLVLGLLGLVSLGAFKDSLQQGMQAKSKLLLGADLSISSRRPLKDSELKVARELLQGAAETESLELFSMVQGKNVTRLSEIRAVENQYPFYGSLTLHDGRKFVSGTPKELEKDSTIWLSKELSLQLEANVGEFISLGQEKFKVTGIMEEDTSSSWTGFSLASPAWIGFSKISRTGLVRPGSSVSYRHLFHLREDQDLSTLSKVLMAKLTDPGIRITTHQRASDQIGRILDYVNDYLGLVSLVALFFSGLGATFLFRSFLTEKLSEIAILLSLGVRPFEAALVFVLQLAALGFFAALIACSLAAMLLPAMGKYLSQFINVSISTRLSFGSIGIAFLLGTVGSVLICLPLLQRVSRLKPSELFSEANQPKLTFDRKGVYYFVLLLFAYWGLACLEANSWVVGSWFVLGFAAAALVVAALGLVLVSLAKLVPVHSLNLSLRLSIRNLTRARLGTLSSFLALGLGAMLLTLIPEIEGNLKKELLAPTLHPLPSLFLFDIQDEQIKNLISWAKEQGISLNTVTPMVRARMTAVNGRPFLRDEREYSPATREDEENARSKNRMFNLNYRLNLSDSETIVKGRSFEQAFVAGGASDKSNLPEITLEVEFAKRLNLHLGDEIAFDVEGVEVKGRVVGLRRVNWMSFEPNFFITFQPGTLDEAPKTWLASIPPVSLERKIAVQKSLVTHFSNVSAVDVENTVRKILNIFVQVGIAIRLMAILTLIAGFAVLFSIAQHQAASRSRETGLLKVLGAQFSDVRKIFQQETVIVAFCAGVVGSLLSLLFSFILMTFLFDMPWHLNFWFPFFSVISIVMISSVLSHFASKRALSVKPLSLLNN